MKFRPETGISIAIMGFALALNVQSASASTVNYSPCLDVAGMGWSGLTCTIANRDFDLPSPANGDKEVNVEAVLSFVFGAPADVTSAAYGVSGNQAGFNFNSRRFGGEKSSLHVQLDQSYDFMTFKAGSIWGIADVRGLTDFMFSTDNLIENNHGDGRNFSYVSFWNASSSEAWQETGDVELLQSARLPGVPEPLSATLMAAGLLGLGLMRRRTH